MIVICCGPPGAGKTTVMAGVERRLAERGRPIGVLRSDEFSRRTYERMYGRVAGTDGDWLLDGTFYERTFREPFRDLEAVYVVRVTASLETCLERNRTRADSIEETGVHVIHREFDPIEADLVVDTDELTAEEAIDRVTRAVADWRSATVGNTDPR